MSTTAYLDENVLGSLDNQSVLQALTEMRELGLLPVISHHHLTEICLGPKPELYIERLRKLNPLFLSLEKSAILARDGKVGLAGIDPDAEISWHKEHLSDLERIFFRSLYPMLKMSGGLVGNDTKQISDDFIYSMRTIVSEALKDTGFVVKFIGGLIFRVKLWSAEREIRKSFASIDFAGEAQKFLQIRKKVVDLGNISQIAPEAVIDAVVNQFDENHRREFIIQFPRNFAKGKLDRANDLAAFAFTMFNLGAVSGSGKVLRGKMDDKKQAYRAQFLDCLHIGKASYFDAFVTSDAGAHRLAAAIYSYAGAPTKAYKLELL